MAREDHIDIAGVLTEQHALELQCVFTVSGIAHFAQAIDALVGVDADDRVVVVGGDDSDADVGDPESARGREWVLMAFSARSSAG